MYTNTPRSNTITTRRKRKNQRNLITKNIRSTQRSQKKREVTVKMTTNLILPPTYPRKLQKQLKLQISLRILQIKNITIRRIRPRARNHKMLWVKAMTSLKKTPKPGFQKTKRKIPSKKIRRKKFHQNHKKFNL
jgi:hypothetical protein